MLRLVAPVAERAASVIIEGFHGGFQTTATWTSPIPGSCGGDVDRLISNKKESGQFRCPSCRAADLAHHRRIHGGSQTTAIGPHLFSAVGTTRFLPPAGVAHRTPRVVKVIVTVTLLSMMFTL